MSRFIKTLTLFLAGLQLMPAKASSEQPAPSTLKNDDDLKGITLQPLNGRFDNLFAGHRSHSSHRSHSNHSSHYSGSSGSSSSYTSSSAIATPSPTPSPPPSAAPSSSTSASGSWVPPGGGPIPASALTPNLLPQESDLKDRARGETASPMSRAEKLHLQVFRVQIKLNTLGLFQGRISGTLDEETKTALRMFQSVKGLPENGLMSTATLNALGIPAVK